MVEILPGGRRIAETCFIALIVLLYLYTPLDPVFLLKSQYLCDEFLFSSPFVLQLLLLISEGAWGFFLSFLSFSPLWCG